MSEAVDGVIPQSAAPFFQEYDLEALDADRDRRLIIERMLASGDRRELRWLFQRYGVEEICQWISQQGIERLPRKRYVFFCTVLELPILPPQGSGIWNR